MIYAFSLFVFVQESFLTKNFFLPAEINLTSRGPLYTCLVHLVVAEIDLSRFDILLKDTPCSLQIFDNFYKHIKDVANIFSSDF